jgi:thiol-disulfide isomerase/thioredoxin
MIAGMHRAARRALLIAVLSTGCATSRSTLVASPLVGQPVDVAAPDLDGRVVRVDGSRGLVQVVDFWATWCDPCRDQFPVLDLLARGYAGQNVAVFAVSLDEDREQVAAFVAAHPTAMVVLWDKGGSAHAERLDVQRLPTTLVVDRAGLVRFVHRGYEPRLAGELDREVRQLLAEPAPAR